MLPKSAEYPETPIYEYPQTNPPFVPNINVLPEGQPLVVLAASMVANDASFNAHNSNVRMFSYNILSDAGWANSAFADLVRSSCDYAVLKFRQGYANSPASALSEAVREMGMLYTSTLVQSFPELSQLISRETAMDASANAQIYYDLMRDLDSMYAAPVHPSTPMGRGAPPPMAGGRQFSRVSQPPAPRSVQVNRMQARPTSAVHTNAATRGQQMSNKPAIMRQPSTASRPPAAAPSPVENTAEQNVIQEGIDAMDRKVHTAIYRGEEFPLPLSPIRRGLEEHIEKLEEQAGGEEIKASPLINSIWHAEASIEDLINTSRAEYVSTDNTASIYICYGLVISPVISANEKLITDCFTRLARAASFAAVAKDLNDILDTAMKSTSKEEVRQTLSLVRQIDRRLTTLVNDFLGNMVESNETRITSFVEDAVDLTRFLNDTFKGNYNAVYNSYQKQILGQLFQHSRYAGDPTDSVASFYEFTQPGVSWDNLITAYSVTYVSASSIELGYDVSRAPKKVMAAKTPLLERLLKASDGIGNKVGMAHRIVVTSDNARYMVFRTKAMSGDDYFTIKEVD